MVRRILGLAIVALLCGCASSPPVPERSVPRIEEGGMVEVASSSAKPKPEVWRYLAFDARQAQGRSLFLWDAWLFEVLDLRAALVGLGPLADAWLRPRVFGEGKKVLFTAGDKAFFWDLKSQERTTPVTDGRIALEGGPQAVVSPDGKWIAYVSNRRTAVLKRADGAFISKTVELTKLAVEAAVLDLDMTADASVLILNLAGRAYCYDVRNPALTLVYPLDLDGGPLLQEVAISPSGKAFAMAQVGGRVLLVDTPLRALDVLPEVNLAVERLLDMYFVSDEVLILVSECRGLPQAWACERSRGWLRRMVAVNAAAF